MLNFWILFITFLLNLSLAYSETIESICQQNSQIAKTVFIDNKCYMAFRYANLPYNKITDNCLSYMKNTSYCQPAHIHSIDEFNELSPKLGLTVSDKFFIGLTRLNCEDKWHWRYGNGTIKLYETTGFRLRQLGMNCDELNFGYGAGDFTTASAFNFSTTQYICECYVPTVQNSTYHSPIISTLLMNLGIFFAFYSLKF